MTLLGLILLRLLSSESHDGVARCSPLLLKDRGVFGEERGCFIYCILLAKAGSLVSCSLFSFLSRMGAGVGSES